MEPQIHLLDLLGILIAILCLFCAYLSYKVYTLRSKIIGTATSLSAHTEKHATVIAKRRGRAPVIYYMIGPVRATEREAIQDLVRWQAAVSPRPVHKPSDKPSSLSSLS